MAEKPKDKKDEKKPVPHKHSSGGMSFGVEIVLFMIAMFIIWILVGKPTDQNTDKPFIQQTTNIIPQ